MGSVAVRKTGFEWLCAAGRWGAVAGAGALATGLTEAACVSATAPPVINLLLGASVAIYWLLPRRVWSQACLLLVLIGLPAGGPSGPAVAALAQAVGLQVMAVLLTHLLQRLGPDLAAFASVERFCQSLVRVGGLTALAALLPVFWQFRGWELPAAGGLVWLTHALAGALGVLLVTPLVLTLSLRRSRAVLAEREAWLYLALIGALGSGIGWWAPGGGLGAMLAAGVIFGLQTWAGMRLRFWVGAAGMLLLTLVLLIPPQWSAGPLIVSYEAPEVRTLELQVFLLSVGVATLLTSTWVAETRVLTAREARYRAVVNDQADLIVRWRPEGTVLFANAACRDFVKTAGLSGASRGGADRLPFADVAEIVGIARGLTPAAPVGLATQHVVGRDDQPIWLEWTSRGFFDADGGLVEIQSVGRDISSRKSLEDLIQDRLRFEELLARTGRLFLDADRSQYEVALREALTELGRNLGVDRLRLIGLVEDSSTWQVLSEYWAPGLTRGGEWGRPLSSDLWNSAGWLAEQTMLGSTVVVERLDDLPESAREERRELERSCVKSLLQVPLRAGGRVLGALYAESLRSERTWTVGAIDRIQLIGGLFADVLARARFETSLRFREDFERLIGDASSRFVNCDARRIPLEIERLLDRIGVFLQIDRCQFLELSEDGTEAERRAEWCAPGIDPLPERGLRLVEQDFLRLAPEMSPARIRQIPRVEDLPAEEAALRAVLQANGVQSIVIIPVIVELESIGMLSLASLRRPREWPAERLPLMAMLGDLLGHAIQRERSARDVDRQRDQLALASRLSVMGEMAAGIAHDVKQPLHAIRAFSASIERAIHAGSAPEGGAVAPPDKLAYWASRISELVDRADGIVRKYRDFCRSSPQERERLPAEQPVLDSLALVETEMQERQIEVELKLDEALPAVDGDRIQLQQVFVNLLKNACDELSEVALSRRRIVISGSRSESAGEEGVEIRVRDFGRGIEQSTADRLFTLFFTTKPNGTGLGLAICQTILADHRGHIRYAPSDPGVTFHVWLPCAAETSS